MFESIHCLQSARVFLMRLPLFSVGVIGFAALFAPQSTLAQVVLDRTFSSKVTLSSDSTQFLITGGTAANRNLFHSFDRFSLNPGQTAIFAPDSTIANIITRVTGNTLSKIDGTIAVQGNANLFLINPNGIAFGNHAALAINGSFFATTAPGLQFADGSILTANPSKPPLLTISAPIGVTGVGEAPITNLGNLSAGKDLSIVAGQVSSSGQFNAGNRISINANTLTLDHGTIAANGGIALNVQDAIALKSSRIDSVVNSNADSGDINVQARSLTLQDGATINTAIRPNAQGKAGNINLEIQDQVNINGESRANGMITPSGITSVIDPNGQGIGGNITLNVGSLQMAGGSNILTVLSGLGRSGSIVIQAKDDVRIEGWGNLPTKVESLVTAEGAGTGGNIRVVAGTISISNRAKINALTLGQAAGGNIDLNARDRITVEGTGEILSWLPLVSSLFLNPNLRIEGNVIKGLEQRLSPKALINASASQTGVLLSSFTSFKSGNLSLTSPKIALTHQALLATNNWGIGDSKGLKVTASEQLILKDSFLFASTLFGKGANIGISTPRLKLDQGVVISGTAQGVGGNITLNVPELLLLRFGSQIAARGFNNANSGNININGNLIVAKPSEESNIIANAVRGRGGNIQINAQSLLGIQYRSALTPQSDITASSRFGINGEVKLNVLRSNPGSDLVKLPAEVTDSSHQIARTCSVQSRVNRLTLTGRGGIAPDLAEMNRSTPVWIDSRTPAQSSQAVVKNDRILEATGWIKNSEGQIVLVAETPGSINPRLAVCPPQ